MNWFLETLPRISSLPHQKVSDAEVGARKHASCALRSKLTTHAYEPWFPSCWVPCCWFLLSTHAARTAHDTGSQQDYVGRRRLHKNEQLEYGELE